MDRTLSLPDLVRLFAPAQPRDSIGDGDGTAGDRLSCRPRPGSRPPNAGAPVRLGAFEGSQDRHGAAGRDHRDNSGEPSDRSRSGGSSSPSDRSAQTDLASYEAIRFGFVRNLSASMGCSVTTLTLFAIDSMKGCPPPPFQAWSGLG